MLRCSRCTIRKIKVHRQLDDWPRWSNASWEAGRFLKSTRRANMRRDRTKDPRSRGFLTIKMEIRTKLHKEGLELFDCSPLVSGWTLKRINNASRSHLQCSFYNHPVTPKSALYTHHYGSKLAPILLHIKLHGFFVSSRQPNVRLFLLPNGKCARARGPYYLLTSSFYNVLSIKRESSYRRGTSEGRASWYLCENKRGDGFTKTILF